MLLKSDLNRSYNDLVVRELTRPNDLVLRGSDKVKLLDMSHSEYFLAIIKTIYGTLVDCNENVNTANVLKSFKGMFRDARDDTLHVTLPAHKTAMGQPEKGELSLDAGWRVWDDVRKHSVLSQTLQNLSMVGNKGGKNISGNQKNCSNARNHSQSNATNNAHTQRTINKACSFYNTKRCYKNVDLPDNNNPNLIWMHICEWCLTERHEKAIKSEPDCPFKGEDQGAKNGNLPARGQ